MAARKDKKKTRRKRIPSVWEEFEVLYPIAKRIAKERRVAEAAAKIVRESSEPGPDVRLMGNYYNDD